MTEEVKIPESRGKFRKDVHERALKVIRAKQSPQNAYRAVGENARESAWGRDRGLEELKGLLNSD